MANILIIMYDPPKQGTVSNFRLFVSVWDAISPGHPGVKPLFWNCYDTVSILFSYCVDTGSWYCFDTVILEHCYTVYTAVITN